MLPTHLHIHGNPSGKPLKTAAELCDSRELCYSCENIISSEIRGGGLHLGFVAEKGSGVRKIDFAPVLSS